MKQAWLEDNEIHKRVLNLLRLALWEPEKALLSVDEAVFSELCEHAVSALIEPILPQLDMSPELHRQWKNKIRQQLIYNEMYRSVQDTLPQKVPYTILKGTSAAQYYPKPENRTLGDIDIMTAREDTDAVCEILILDGWRETTNESDAERGRHRVFKKHYFTIEVHAFFASVNEPEKAKILDDLIIDHINSSHVLPDMINGLVLIDHINQHLEVGIGLRQIIDWMMFADKCLTDEGWEAFRPVAQATGFETLAVTTTRMCELYLGLPEHKWCNDASEELCSNLMEYVMRCGNFGSKQYTEEEIAIARAGKLRHPIKAIKELQEKGEENWRLAGNPGLKPFAWAWQGMQFLKGTPGLTRGYAEARRRDRMFDELGVMRSVKGLAAYKDGEYKVE